MKKRHIKQLILSFVSLITLSTITISSVVSCSNNTTTLTTEQNKKQSNTKQNNKLIAKIENILKNKSVSVNGYKNKSVQTILDNENSKQSLQQNIEQTIINKIISSSNNQLLRSEIANNLKIKFSNQSENNTLNNKGEIPVTVYYDGQSLGVFNVQGFSSPLLPVEQQTPSISFSNQQYILNLQNSDNINNFEVKPTIQNWKTGYQLQYYLTIDGTTIKPLSIQNTIQPFTFSKNTFNALVQDNPQYQNAKYLSLTLTAVIIPSDYEDQIKASTQIVVQDNPLFLYASPSYNTNLQSTNLDCYADEQYYLNFIQYQNVSNNGSIQYSLIENTNTANSNSTITLPNNMQISSSQMQSSIDKISKYAQFGIVTYWLEIINTATTQVIMKSNPLTIDCNKQGGISITNPNTDTNTSTLNVNLSKTTTCTLTLNNNVPGIVYSEKDIYYQVAENDNQWEPITDVTNLFSATLNNNQLILSNLASNVGINIQVKNANTHLYSNIFTINTIAPTSMWTQFIHDGTNETLVPNTSYDSINYNKIIISNDQVLNLKFLVPNINLSNVQYGWSILQSTGFVPVGSDQATFTKSWSISGTCILRMLISWPNDIRISPLIYLFKVQIGTTNSNLLQNANTGLNDFIKQKSNLENVALSFFQKNISDLLPFIDTPANAGWNLAPNVSTSNCATCFEVNNCFFNNYNLLQFNLTVLSSISVDNSSYTESYTINSGTTLILTTPFQPSSFVASNSVKADLSELNVSTKTAVQTLSSSQSGHVGWELQNFNNANFNNKFYSIMVIGIYPLNSMTITSNNSTLPNFLNNSNYATHAMVWNMQTPSQINIDYKESGASDIVFDPFFFPNPSSVTYSWYDVSGNEVNSKNIDGKLLESTSSSGYMINISNIKTNETFTYYCICSYTINSKTYTSRSQNILVVFSDN